MSGILLGDRLVLLEYVHWVGATHLYTVINCRNQAWVADVAYIWIPTGFAYLAPILDAYFRCVIWHTVSIGLDTVLTLEALCVVIVERYPGPGIIHHSDQGVQYASTQYVDGVRGHGFEMSMAR